MNIIIIGTLIFVILLFIVELSIYAYNVIANPDRSKVRKRLQTLSITKLDRDEDMPDLIRKRVLSEIPIVNRILHGIPGLRFFENLRRQAGAKYPLGFFILSIIVLAVTGLLSSIVLIPDTKVLPFVIAIAAGAIPVIYLQYKKKRKMDKFTQQLPEALDLISRAMKAGQAFTTGLGLVAEEFGEPIGPEFSETLDEINFGMSVESAMRSLADRVDSPDLKIFAVAVILQRETGGNLSEIMETISDLIRKRFQLYGKVKTLSAEGRLSGVVLVALPFVLMGALTITSPGYLDSLFQESVGKTLLTIAAIMMLCGIMIIRKIINIKV